MKGIDWLSERMLFGILVIVGYLVAIGTAAYFPVLGASHDVVTGAIASLGTAVGMVVQAVFRSDRTDRQTAETTDKLADAVNTAMTLSPTPASQ